MKRVTLILFLITFISEVQGQVNITGRVLNIDNEPLAHVNVGIIGTHMGTVSNKNGEFKLNGKTSSISNTDSLRFSMIGYYSQTMAIKKLHPTIEIHLKERIFEFEEVKVLADDLKNKTIGRFNTSVLNMRCNFSLSDFEDQNLGSEIGKKFSISNKSTWIDSLHFYILQNNYDTVGFRINIYSVKENKPHKNLLKQEVIYEIKNKSTDWMVVDLTPYKIKVDNDIIVSLQWIYKSEKGNVLSLPISMPTTYTHYYKYGFQNNWKSFKSMTTKMKLDIRN